MFRGVYTALVTPFHRGKVDYKSLVNLVRHQVRLGVDGFVVNGTTAESPTLEPQEVAKIYATVKAEVGESKPILLGAGQNSTAGTVAKVKAWNRWKPDGFLIVTPYYNKPPQEGLHQHFRAIAAAAKWPVVLYNVPSRTAVNMSVETTVKLSKVKNIVGVKEASGDLLVAKQLGEEAPKRFSLLSGDDKTAMNFCLLGGHGVISVVSHLIPKEMTAICQRAVGKDEGALELWQRFDALNSLMGVETNPIPVKAALQMMGIIASDEMRLPLISMSAENKKKLRSELKLLELV